MQYIPENLVERAFYHADLDWDENLRQNYSGRGMYGRNCFGIVHDYQGQLIKFLLFLEKVVVEEIQDNDNFDIDPDLVIGLADAASSDSMGLSKITYFPGFTIGDDSDGDDEE